MACSRAEIVNSAFDGLTAPSDPWFDLRERMSPRSIVAVSLITGVSELSARLK